MKAGVAASTYVSRVRQQPWGLAVAVIADGATEFAVDAGADALDTSTMFQIGSITKTMTGILLADAVTRGQTTLDATAGSILGPADAGNCGDVRLIDLATQHSGLPRLPPNLRPDAIDPKDPYAAYREADLIEALAQVEKPQPGQMLYSNFGFMLLGVLLERVSGAAYADLIAQRIFGPLSMTTAVCGVPERNAIPGYAGASQTPWWLLLLPGPGGVACSITDLAGYIRGCLAPPPEAKAAIDLSLDVHATGDQPMGLGWVHQGGGHWHNGGTGGFRSFCAMHRPTGTAVAALANSGDAEVLDRIGMGLLTELARERV